MNEEQTGIFEILKKWGLHITLCDSDFIEMIDEILYYTNENK